MWYTRKLVLIAELYMSYNNVSPYQRGYPKLRTVLGSSSEKRADCADS